ncbi:MAG: RluA family pseudouridine synthase [Lachnospiraceae bacterium]|nr:RluA family pseudouridine synthase [Lachnospiraceae bacterium]
MKKEISYQVSLEEDENKLEQVLRRSLELSPREIRRAKFRPQGICVNGVRRRVTETVRQGERITVCLEEEGDGQDQLVAVAGELQVLYEDGDVLAVCKPPGQVCHPSGGHYADTLANVMQDYFQRKGQQGRIRLIGRLDQETSGIVLAAKSQAAASRLSKQREQGILKKEYLALAAGNPLPDQGWVEEPIGPAKNRTEGKREAIRMQVRPDGKPARTFYETLAQRDGVSLLRLTLDTGRTHQIRVHMAWLGCPLLGDTLYAARAEGFTRAALHAGTGGFTQAVLHAGAEGFTQAALHAGTGGFTQAVLHAGAEGFTQAALHARTGGFTRAALHAWRLAFCQPFTGEPIVLQAPFPEDFAGYLVHFPQIVYNGEDVKGS